MKSLGKYVFMGVQQGDQRRLSIIYVSKICKWYITYDILKYIYM